MTDALRKKINTRTKNWNTVKPSPSELKSERLRKKLARGQPIVTTRQTDCNGCSKHPCGKTINECDEPTRTDRCALCGIKVVYRYVEGQKYYCPICLVKR